MLDRTTMCTTGFAQRRHMFVPTPEQLALRAHTLEEKLRATAKLLLEAKKNGTRLQKQEHEVVVPKT
eukprot:5289825-Pyramimonas_sp.AAC.1